MQGMIKHAQVERACSKVDVIDEGDQAIDNSENKRRYDFSALNLDGVKEGLCHVGGRGAFKTCD
jgi:hypothetical protein